METMEIKLKDKIIKATGDELSRLLGEVLQPQGQHLWRMGKCRVCKQMEATRPMPCVKPIPINDWNVAMKWRDWAVKEYGEHEFLSTVREVVLEEFNIDPSRLYLACMLTSKQILKAAANCKLTADKQENDDE